METLNNEQSQQVQTWVSEGANLATVQNKIAEEFGITLTYMDVRFLVDDLGAVLKSDPKPQEPKKEPSADTPLDEAGSVSVSLNKVQRPGAVASGDVTFSDGVEAQWQIDPMGQLGLVPSQEGYQPSPEDIQEFQEQLRGLLR